MSENPRKPYQQPKIEKLTPEQAQFLLLGHISKGDQKARKLLELIYPEPPVES